MRYRNQPFTVDSLSGQPMHVAGPNVSSLAAQAAQLQALTAMVATLIANRRLKTPAQVVPLVDQAMFPTLSNNPTTPFPKLVQDVATAVFQAAQTNTNAAKALGVKPATTSGPRYTTGGPPLTALRAEFLNIAKAIKDFSDVGVTAVPELQTKLRMNELYPGLAAVLPDRGAFITAVLGTLRTKGLNTPEMDDVFSRFTGETVSGPQFPGSVGDLGIGDIAEIANIATAFLPAITQDPKVLAVANLARAGLGAASAIDQDKAFQALQQGAAAAGAAGSLFGANAGFQRQVAAIGAGFGALDIQQRYKDWVNLFMTRGYKREDLTLPLFQAFDTWSRTNPKAQFESDGSYFNRFQEATGKYAGLWKGNAVPQPGQAPAPQPGVVQPGQQPGQQPGAIIPAPGGVPGGLPPVVPSNNLRLPNAVPAYRPQPPAPQPVQQPGQAPLPGGAPLPPAERPRVNVRPANTAECKPDDAGACRQRLTPQGAVESQGENQTCCRIKPSGRGVILSEFDSDDPQWPGGFWEAAAGDYYYIDCKQARDLTPEYAQIEVPHIDRPAIPCVRSTEPKYGSLVVPKGWSVQLFSKPNLQGKTVELEPGEYNLASIGLTDRPYSMRVRGPWTVVDGMIFEAINKRRAGWVTQGLRSSPEPRTIVRAILNDPYRPDPESDFDLPIESYESAYGPGWQKRLQEARRNDPMLARMIDELRKVQKVKVTPRSL